jgi:hypothetical protein
MLKAVRHLIKQFSINRSIIPAGNTANAAHPVFSCRQIK